MSTIAHARSHAITHAWRGIVAGLVGGVVFGILMAMMGMMTSVAMLVGAQSAGVGWVVHLIISAAFGLVFGLLAGAIADRVWSVLGAGLVYGVAWWVVGGLLLMPAFLGMPVFQFGQTAWMSLLGHVIYGLVTAAALFGLSRREV